jgi:hypothetical protein
VAVSRLGRASAARRVAAAVVFMPVSPNARGRREARHDVANAAAEVAGARDLAALGEELAALRGELVRHRGEG